MKNPKKNLHFFVRNLRKVCGGRPNLFCPKTKLQFFSDLRQCDILRIISLVLAVLWNRPKLHYYVLTARIQEHLHRSKFNDWSTMYNSIWNTYGIFMGECSSNLKSTKALKLLMALWMLYCFIICASYGGVVKAFLTSPQFSSAIETPQDVGTTQFYILVLFI